MTLRIDNVFIRYRGASYEIAFDKLDIGEDLRAEHIKRIVEQYLDLNPGSLDNYVVDIHTHAIVVRPEAKFG